MDMLGRIADMHTHILPRMDDGSKSSNESICMLEALFSQGVGKVVATPHFYASKSDPDEFFKRREASIARLNERLLEKKAEGAEYPEVYVGAEVEYFSAMASWSDLEKMCIEGTRLLLVEMPFSHWSRRMVDEICSFKEKLGIEPVIAHIDRYFSFFEESMLEMFKKSGVVIQCNADAFLRFSTRRKALKLLSEGYVGALGTDCHDMEKRAPNMSDAIGYIEKKLGKGAADPLIKSGEELLRGARPIGEELLHGARPIGEDRV